MHFRKLQLHWFAVNLAGCKNREDLSYLGNLIFGDYLGVFATVMRRVQKVIQPLVAIVPSTWYCTAQLWVRVHATGTTDSQSTRRDQGCVLVCENPGSVKR